MEEGFDLLNDAPSVVSAQSTQDTVVRSIRGANTGTVITAHDQVKGMSGTQTGETGPSTSAAAAVAPAAKNVANSNAHMSAHHAVHGIVHHTGRDNKGGDDEKTKNGDGSAISAFTTLWREPIPDVAPSAAYGWKSYGAHRSYATWVRDNFSPQFIADPLYVIGYRYQTKTDTPNTTNERVEICGRMVSVTTQPRHGVPPPPFSARGDMLWLNAHATPVDASMQMRTLIPTGGSINLQTMMVLMSKYGNCLQHMARDEAPLVRMLLMLLTFIPSGYAALTSNSILRLNLGSKLKKTERTYHPYDKRGNLSGTVQIPADCKDCSVVVIPLSVYVKKLCGVPVLGGADAGRYDNINLENANVIAIEGHNLQQKWFLPFLIAHTSTLWWNCAITEEHTMDDDRKSTPGSQFFVKTMSRASCVVVPGNYKNIVIVVVDYEGNADYHWNIPHLVDGVEWGAKIAEFDTKVFKYLGLDEQSNPPDIAELVMALREMCKRVALDGDMKVVTSMVQDLAFNVPMGGWMSTTGVSGTQGCGRYDVVADTYKIDGSKTRDLGVDYDTIANWLEGFGDWSVSPSGRFCCSRFKVNNKWKEAGDKEERDSRFALYKYIDHVYECSVTESLGVIRVMREAGLFAGRVACESKWEYFHDVFNSLQAGASLLAGVMGWMMCESGFNVMDLNGMYMTYERGPLENPAEDVVVATTNGFLQEISSCDRKWCKNDQFVAAMRAYHGMITTDNTRLLLSLWPSIHVPFWFIQGCMMKFECWKPVKNIFPSPIPMFDVSSADPATTLAGMGVKMAYMVTAQDDDWRVFPLLCAQRAFSCSVDGYDFEHPLIYFPGIFNVRPKTGAMGWVPYTYLDRLKAGNAAKGWVDSVFTEPLAVPMPKMRQWHNPRSQMKAYVVGPRALLGSESMPMTVSMIYPDPPVEWLKRVWDFVKTEAKVAVPHLLTGDVTGALAAMGIDTVIRAVNALGEKFGEKRKFTGAATDGSKFEHVSSHESREAEQ